MEQAKQRGLTNIQAITQNVVTLQPQGQYDRVVSVEMLEHMKNYKVRRSRACCLRHASATSNALLP